jgi:hypothetical protein
VAGLRPALDIIRLLKLCTSTATPVNVSPGPELCFEHPGKEVDYYCEACGEPICLLCIKEHHRHHHCVSLKEAFRKYQEEVGVFLEPMEEQIETLQGALLQFDIRCEEISSQQTATRSDIHSTFMSLREALNVRENELTCQLDLVTRRKLKGLAVQKDHVETSLAKLASCVHFIKESIGPIRNEGDVLMMKANTLKTIHELNVPFQSDLLQPNTEANITFSVSADITRLCQTYGQVSLQDMLVSYEENHPTCADAEYMPLTCKQSEHELSECIPESSQGECERSEHEFKYKLKQPQGQFNSGDLEFSFTVNCLRDEQAYSWTGLCLYLPTPPPEGTHGTPIHLKTDIKGSYHFPPKSKPVSAVYQIDSDLAIETRIELEHCYKGDLNALAFAYCDSKAPPFDFRIAKRNNFHFSFTPTHGVVTTNHFSHWVIVWLSEGFKGAINRLVGYQLLKTYSDLIRINAFYCIKESHIRVDIVFQKGLSAHSEVRKFIVAGKDA